MKKDIKKLPQWPADIIFDIRGVLFDWEPSSIDKPSSTEISPIIKGLELLRQCYNMKDAEGNRLHKLYVLSNCKSERFIQLIAAYEEIFELFDGIVISGHVNLKKPDQRIFQHLLSKYSLNPATCVFIDDAQSNVIAAQQLGITGITCTNILSVEQELKTLNVL